jgi:hypothetical protein
MKIKAVILQKLFFERLKYGCEFDASFLFDFKK